MRSHRSLALVPILAFAPMLAAQKGGVAEPRVGLQVAPPKGWLELPGDHDRHATLRLFVAPRALATKGEGNHTPVMRVMFFAKGGDASKDLVDGLPRTTPFRSLEDFAQRGLGAKDVAKEAHKVGTADGQRVTAKDIPGEHVLFGQTIALDDGEAAVCIELLANHADKLKKDVDAVLASIEIVARVLAARTEVPWVADAEWTKKDATARAAARRKWAEEVVAATAKNPELGYKVSKSKYWTVLSAADPAFTKKVVDAAEAGRDWLAKKMPEITKDAPLPAVLRVFDAADPYQALQIARNDQREYDQFHRELYAANDRDNGGPAGFGPVLRAVAWQILDDVDPAVLPAMPRWFDNGLWEFLRSSKFDGKKLDFVSGDVERGRIEYYRQKNEELLPLWGMIKEKSQLSPTDGSLEKDWAYTPDCSRLMRWLWQGDGLKAFNKPTFVSDYVKALAASHDKLGADPVGDVPTIGLTDDQKKERNNRFYKWRDDLLITTNDTVLPLQPDAWKAINEKWVAFNKAFK